MSGFSFLWLCPESPVQCWLKEHHKSHAPALLSVSLNLWHMNPYHAVTGKWTQRFRKGSNKLTNYVKTSFFLEIKVGTIIDSSAQDSRKKAHGAMLTQASLSLLGWGVSHPQSHIQDCCKLGKPEPGLSKAHQLEQPSVGYRAALLPLGYEPVGGDQGHKNELCRKDSVATLVLFVRAGSAFLKTYILKMFSHPRRSPSWALSQTQGVG